MQGPEHGARRDWVRSGEVVWVQIRPYEKMRIHTVEVEAQSDPGPDPALKNWVWNIKTGQDLANKPLNNTIAITNQQQRTPK